MFEELSKNVGKGLQSTGTQAERQIGAVLSKIAQDAAAQAVKAASAYVEKAASDEVGSFFSSGAGETAASTAATDV